MRYGLTARVSPMPFAADVRYYLTQEPRQLPSCYLYDALGSALFEAICRLPWYPLARAEARLIASHGREIFENREPVSRIVELGPGSGAKLAALVDAGRLRPTPRPVGRSGEASRGPLELHLVDVSAAALDEATRTLDVLGDVHIVKHETTYEAGLAAFAAEPPAGLPRRSSEEFQRAKAGRSMAVFLGSNIGNFDPPGREVFLRRVRKALRPSDTFLIGFDLVKPERDLVLAYDDPLGVTASFNRNLLVRINRELGGTVDVDGFAHRAVWNPAHSRVEMHLVSRRVQQVTIPAAQLDFQMAEGESIWTESSYKYRVDEIGPLLEDCGFRVVAQWIDREDRFALTHAEAV